MKGYIIKYKPFDSNSRVSLNHDLFGRIVYRNYRGKKYAYYKPGLLDQIKFYRLTGGKIFVTEKVDVERLRDLGSITIEEAERDEKELLLTTGEEYWTRIAKEKDLFFKRAKK